MTRNSSEIDVQQLLGLRQQPIAIGFLPSVPAGLPRWDGPALAAGCGFWPRAMAGRSFYTLAADHFNCAVGCHVHRFELPAERLSPTQDAAVRFRQGLPANIVGEPSR